MLKPHHICSLEKSLIALKKVDKVFKKRKKVISFQTSGWTKRGQEFIFNKEKINPLYIKNSLT